MTAIKSDLPCPCGSSSDAFATYADGTGHCFSCSKHWPKDSFDGSEVSEEVKKEPTPIPLGHYIDLPDRKLSKETCKKYDISVVKLDGKEYHIYGYYDNDNTKVMAKVRKLPKCFSPKEDFRCGTKGDTIHSGLFGKQSFKAGGKAIVITEGEYDAASYYEMFKYPAVSVRSSSLAVNDVTEDYEFLNSFDEVVFCFDADTEGRKAAKKCADLFPGKAKIINMCKHKDANDYLKNGDAEVLRKEYFSAKEIKLGGVSGSKKDWLEASKIRPIAGIPLIWDGLNLITRGVRFEEVWTFGGGTKIGKSEILKELTYGLVIMTDYNIGMLMLEESDVRTKQCLMGKELNKRYYLEGEDWPTDFELEKAAEIFGGRVYQDTLRSSKWEDIEKKIQYMVNALGCKFIMLDHLTAVAEGTDGDINSILHTVLEKLNNIAVREKITFFCISHLNQSANKNHEEGARVTLRDFYGSGAIKQRSNFVFGFEGDLHGENIPKNRRLLRCLADREAGDGGGKVLLLDYNPKSGRLLESDDLELEEENE